MGNFHGKRGAATFVGAALFGCAAFIVYSTAPYAQQDMMAHLCLVSEGFAGMAARPMNLGSINILLFLQESAIIYRT